MKLVGLEQMKTGEKLAYPIYSASGRVILNAGSIITESYIDKLKKMGIYSVYIDDDKFNDIELAEAISINTRGQANSAFKEAYENFHSNKTINEYKILDAIKMVVDDIKSNATSCINTLSTMAIEDHKTAHAINVCILSLLIGNNMNYSFSQLVDLGVGAMIHDIAESECEAESIDHIKKGFEIMKSYRGLSLHSVKVIYEHHENFDGSGYPREISGDAISQYARIVSVADFYDELLYGKKGPGLQPHEAYEALLAETNKRFDPEVVEAFRKCIAVFPNGCSVTLSNGKIGVVVRQNNGVPHRPVVRIVEDGKIKKDMDLISDLTLFIKNVNMG